MLVGSSVYTVFGSMRCGWMRVLRVEGEVPVYWGILKISCGIAVGAFFELR